MPGVLTCASLLSCSASSPSHLARASYNFAESANPCEITFLQLEYAEPTLSWLLQPCRVLSPGRVYFSASASSPSHLARASYNFAESANPCEITFLQLEYAEPTLSWLLQPCRVLSPGRVYFSASASSPSHLARASYNFAESANPCEITFLQLEYAEPTLSWLLQPCRVLSPGRVYFSASASSPSHLARASYNFAESANPCEITFLQLEYAEPTLSWLLQPCRVLSPGRVYFSASASSPSHLARASYNFAESANPCEITFLQLEYAEPTLSWLLQPCRVLSPGRVYFSASASSPSHLARASYNFAESANPCEITFLQLEYAEPTLSWLLQPCRVLSPGRVYFSASASSPSHLARASYNFAESANPCEITFLQLEYAEPTLSWLLQPCRVLSPGRVYFSASASSPSHLARASYNFAESANPCEITFLQLEYAEPTLSWLLQPCRVLSPGRVYFSASASSPSHLARASYNFAESANPCEITFLQLEYAEPTLSWLLQPCRVLSPGRVYFSASASSPSHLARASYNFAESANPCEITFLQLEYAEPTLSWLLQPCRVLSPGRVYFSASASSPSHLARASYNFAESANPCEITFLQLEYAEPTLSWLLQPCRVLSPGRVYFSASASSPSHLARASYNFAESANPCEITFLQLEYAEPTLSWLLQPCRVLSPGRVYFLATQVRRATSLLPLATLPDLQTRARILSCAASSPSHLACASCNLAGSANPC
ncbi:hypothetical protein CRG98_016483 [Punica granatum]|uniref:Uncharacterized protein n=1 Tax=Punica granatum TaxID=22663 RepID=A0A2I0K4P9_PUNGR|nr:hypothetical protein CRG98_016483 [Punica granatum]